MFAYSPANMAWFLSLRYAFDIHCNAFFASFLLSHVAQFLLLPLLLADSLAACVASATLWAAALGVYVFVTHLGYRSLPFLKHTELFLYPLAPLAFAWVAAVVLATLGYRLNPTRVRHPN
jgi:hypothetical protein